MIIRHRRQNVVNFFAQKGEEEEADAGDGKKVFDRPVDIFIQVCNLQQRHCYLADQGADEIGVNPESWNEENQKVYFDKKAGSSNQKGKLCFAESVDNAG